VCLVGNLFCCCFQTIDERFYLVFPGVLVILAVGQTLSGYELQVGVCVCCAVL